AALSVLPSVPASAEQAYVYQALGHAEPNVRRQALRVLAQLAAESRVAEVDAALLRTLQDDDVETRELALHVLAALGTPEALAPFLALLGDEQPRVRETLVRSVKRFGRQAMTPLLERLGAPRTSVLAKEPVLFALARLEGVQAPRLFPFGESPLRDIYKYRLILACLDGHEPLASDTFLRIALQNAHDQLLTLVLHLLAVWASPEVARLLQTGLP